MIIILSLLVAITAHWYDRYSSHVGVIWIKSLASYALSAITMSGSKPSTKAGAWMVSESWPAVKIERYGLPSASTAESILALNPPGERPIAWGPSFLHLRYADELEWLCYRGEVVPDQYHRRPVLAKVSNPLFCPNGSSACRHYASRKQVASRWPSPCNPQHSFNEQWCPGRSGQDHPSGLVKDLWCVPAGRLVLVFCSYALSSNGDRIH